MRVVGLGTAAMDTVLMCSQLPREDGFAFVTSEEFLPGGSCANVLTALAGLGTPAAMIAAIGDDVYGLAFSRDLQQCGVDSRYLLVRPGGTTLHTLVTVSEGGARAIFCSLGDSLMSLEEGEVGPIMLEGACVFYTDLFPAPPALKLARLARERGVKVVFNLECPPSFMARCGVKRSEIEEMMSLADLFITGREGVGELTGSEATKETADELYNRCRPSAGLVVTLGEKGAVWVRGNETIEQPPLAVDAVDSTGAGDAFTAGLIHAYFVKGMTPNMALRYASACGALKCTRLGARLRASEEEVERFLKQEPLD